MSDGEDDFMCEEEDYGLVNQFFFLSFLVLY
jgi:hypothetical protein